MYNYISPGYNRRKAYSEYLNTRYFCPICQKHIKLYERTWGLECSHRFHRNCIIVWLSIKNICPVCRQSYD